MEQKEPAIKYERSAGKAKGGIPIFFVRPQLACNNRSRRYIGYDKLRKGIQRWYGPEVKFYLVDGHLIGSNKPANALHEYWRICEREKIGRIFEVIEYAQK